MNLPFAMREKPTVATAPVSPPADDVMQLPSVITAKAIVARNDGFRAGELERAREAIERAGRDSIEFGILKALYGTVDRRTDAMFAASQAAAAQAQADKMAAFRAARKPLWQRLTREQRALFQAASEGHSSISAALVRAAQLTDIDLSDRPIPGSFEPERA